MESINYIDKRIKKCYFDKKGHGFIATNDIPKNTIILKEYPSFLINNYKQSYFEIFELIYTILISDNVILKKKFMNYLPHKVNNNFTIYIKSIKTTFIDLEKNNKKLYQYLTSNYKIDEIILFCLKYICNAFNFFDKGPAILLTGSIFNHSCNPNIIFGKKNDIMCFFTIRDIKKDEELCNSYTNIFKSTKYRKLHLLSQYGFECDCDRCLKNKKIPELFDLINEIKINNKDMKFNNI